MKKTISARHKASQQVSLTLSNNRKKVSKIPALLVMLNSLTKLLDNTNDLIIKAGSIPTKTAGNKNLARTELIGITLKISNIVKVYAFISKNENLNNFASNNNSSSMLHMRDHEVLNYSENLLEQIKPISKDLADYGLNEEMTNELNDEIKSYKKLMTEPRQLISERKTTNELIEDHIDQIQSLLSNQIDPMMELFVDDKEFYLSYKSARMIVDPATRKQAEVSETIEE